MAKKQSVQCQVQAEACIAQAWFLQIFRAGTKTTTIRSTIIKKVRGMAIIR